ncbi:MAG: hypothetical protein RKE49_04905 [Oceanicaulis sp.]
MLGAHIQLGRDALHALSLGAAGFALFGGADAAASIAYIGVSAVLHLAAHGLIGAGRLLEGRTGDMTND